MTPATYLPARQRSVAVLRAIAAGADSVVAMQRALPDTPVNCIRKSLISLRTKGYLSAIRNDSGYTCTYKLTQPLEHAVNELMPVFYPMQIEALEEAMPMPASVRQVLDGQHGVRVVVGRAGLNAP